MTLPYKARDDIGVETATVNIALDIDSIPRLHGLEREPEPRAEIEIEIPVLLADNPQLIESDIIDDFAEHPWAGLPVIFTLSAQDGAGQSAPLQKRYDIFPSKRFFDPLAAAIIEERRELLWSRENSKRVTQILRAISWKPENIFRNQKSYLLVRSTIRRLEINADTLSDEIITEVSERLWAAALLIEEGDINDARERLERAQERLSEAMRQGATDDEIAELMRELREATDDYIAQLAEEGEEQQNQQAGNQTGQNITQDQLQEMMNQIEELMQQGRMAEAQELLNQLMQMMENLQVTQNQNGQGGEGGEQSSNNPSDQIEEQQNLADETFEELQEEFRRNQEQFNNRGQQQGEQNGQPQPNQNRGQNNQGQNPSQERGNSSPSDRANGIAERQEELRERLENRDGTGGERAEEEFNQAEQQMDDAAEALREGDLRGALDAQADALESLRRGLEESRDANQQQNDQARDEDGQTEEGTDPLGRTGQNGTDGSNEEYRVGDPTDDREKLRALDKEIKKRLGEEQRPKQERDYLERLLDRF